MDKEFDTVWTSNEKIWGSAFAPVPTKVIADLNSNIALINGSLSPAISQPQDAGRSISGVSTDELGRINQLITTYFNTIPHTDLLMQLKDYEEKYKMISSDFYSKWRSGSIPSTPEYYEWSNIYRIISNEK